MQALYPDRSPEASDTALDTALKSLNFVEAWRLLEQERSGRSDRDLWLSSVGSDLQPDREDIRRAMLVLCDRSPGPDTMWAVMHQAGFKSGSKATMDFIKSLEPYHSPVRQLTTDDPSHRPKTSTPAYERMVGELGGVPMTHSGRVHFDSGKVIACEEIAAGWTDGLDGDGKPDYSKFQKPEDVKRNMTETPGRPAQRMASAARSNLVPNDQWGAQLAAEFRDMKERGETLRRFDVRTSDHMMSTALKIKNKPEDGHRDKHVVKTFDPNVILGHTRIASLGDLDAIERLHFNQVTPTPTHHSVYHKDEARPMTMLSESPPAGWDANLPTRQLDDTGRRLEVPWEGPIDATVLLHLLKGGFEGDLRDMEQRILDHFRSLPRDEGIAFLRAANARGSSGLEVCALMGNAATMKAYCEVLGKANLTRDEARTLILQTVTSQPPSFDVGAPLLHLPRLSATGQVYLEHALPLLHSDDRLQALSGRYSKGELALFGPLRNANESHFDACCECIHRNNVPLDQRKALLMSVGHQALPDKPQIVIFNNDNAGVRSAFGELVVAMGLQDDRDVQAVLRVMSDLLARKDPQMETYRCQMLESVCRTIRSSGSDADQRDRSDLIGMHARNPNNRTAVLDPESVLAIRQAGSDLVMVDQDLVQNALRKYEQFQDQGAVLVHALMAFNDPSTAMEADGDDSYRYRMDSATHGPCEVDFQFARNRVTELRVRDASGEVVAAMRPFV